MFQDADLTYASQNEYALRISSFILAEFNLNDQENISKIGNYRYRPFGNDGQFLEAISTYDEFDFGDYYTDANVSYENYSDTADPQAFVVEEKSRDMYYSLGDCFFPFRPRSGINKARFINNNYIDNIRSGTRPRYYMPSRSDYFKYWSSYRKESGIERGVSFPAESQQGGYGIDDACPFIVYKKSINANRITVKMQTNVGSLDLGTIRTSADQAIDDPLFSYSKATVPEQWKIQVLDSNSNWIDAMSFAKGQTRIDGSPIIPKDGHVEIFYGIKSPQQYERTFNFVGYTKLSLLPNLGLIAGYAYVVDDADTPQGLLKVWNGEEWETFSVEYGWTLNDTNLLETNGVLTQIVDPSYYTVNGNNIFREFAQIKGIRIVVKTMNTGSAPLDIIEISPRLVANISSYVESFDITKSSAYDETGLPVGALSVSNGAMNIVNFDNAFSSSNIFNGLTGSLVSEYAEQNVKFVIYETVLDVYGYDKYVPLKTFYAESFPKPAGGDSSISIQLRDFFFRLESVNAPQMLSQECTLTYAIATLLDNAGFSNYIFKNISTDNDPVLPFFFVEPNVSVAEILNRLAVATQTAMFFDEYNNFVVMSKEYLLPEEGARDVDLVLLGDDNPVANIEAIESNETRVINDGQIEYTIRYIQREVSSLSATNLLDSERTYKYKPVLLWEVAATEETKTINEAVKTSSGYALGAMALNNNLSSDLPTVINRAIINNTVDVGESIYWLPRFQGYLYANGEIIRFDAVEYSVPGSANSVVWITNNQEYQKYFRSLSFNGKMFPTGRIRIYTEPYYEDIGGTTFIKNGEVRVHGRGQFGTDISSHTYGLPSYWSDTNNTYGVQMYSELLFSTVPTENIVNPSIGSTQRTDTSVATSLAKKSQKNGIIKNFMSSKVFSDGATNALSTTQSGTVQSSALVFKGPSAEASIANHRDLVSYIYKDLSNSFSYRHFGTRMRIIGRVDRNFGQVANGSSNYFSVQAQANADSTSLNGGSGGLGIMVDPANGSGYYFEIAALTEQNIEKYVKVDGTGSETAVVHNILFYKVNKNAKTGDTASSPATPIKLWGGLSNILVDAGLFAGQDRIAISENNTVYDLSVEYEVLSGGVLRFYLYINNILIKIVDDSSPLEVKTSVALFTRAGTECMFENLYAIEDLVAKNSNSLVARNTSVFDDNGVTTNEFMKKYAMSGIVQQTYLSNISPDSNTQYRVYFEEFGTILRECAYFNIQYDQAYPAFYSKIGKTFSPDRGYTVSKFYGGPYGAEFLVFNATDKTIVLDETTGNYLRILGITFTQNTSQTLTVDSYFGKLSNKSDPTYQGNELVSPQKSLQQYNKIKASRNKYGSRQFSLNSMYIQSDDFAKELMGWIINRTMRPRRELSIKTFPMPQIQLGDLVTIEYTMPDEIEFVDPATKFVVTGISYSRSMGEISQTLKVCEV